MNLPVNGKSRTDLSRSFMRLSSRERWLLGLLALVAVVVAPVLAFVQAADAKSRHVAAQAELDAAQRHARNARGGGLSAQIAQQRREIQGWSWSATSPAVGRVVVQSEIESLAARAGFAQPQVKAADKVERQGEIDLVRVDLTAPADWPALAAFFTALDSGQKGFLIESVALSDDREPRMKIGLKLPLIVGGDAVS